MRAVAQLGQAFIVSDFDRPMPTVLTAPICLLPLFAAAWSGFEAGDSVAVFGAGSVDLLAAYSALLRGAPRVYSVDRVRDRLDLAASIGAIPINSDESDPVEQFLAFESNGARRGVEAVG
ncbi:hypothetical protein BDW66DRAFT_150170 [Aspergillus desertorum]